MSTVQSVVIKKQGEGAKGPWTMYQITTTDGTKATGFDVVHVGDTVELQQDGKYLNYAKVEAKPGQKPPVNAPEPPPARLNGSEIEKYAAYSRKVFERAWFEAEQWISAMPKKDREDLSVSDYYDLQMRVAQHIAIETAKIIRKERF